MGGRCELYILKQRCVRSALVCKFAWLVVFTTSGAELE